MKSHYNRTASEIHRLGFREPFLRSKGGPFIKLLNWFTGIGKTYSASVFAIELFIKEDVIPVFIAPLQSLVKGFADDVKQHGQAQGYADEIEELLRQRGETVRVHRLYSREYHENDRAFFQAAISLYEWLRSNPDVFSELEKREKPTETRSGISKALDDMRRTARICLESSFHDLHPRDDTYEDARAAYTKAALAAISAANRVVRRLIVLDVDRRTYDRPGPTIIAAELVGEMVRRLQPLQAFLDHPGIIVSTASKSQVRQEVYAYDEELGRNKWLTFETLPEFLRELNRDGSLLGKRVSRRPDSARVVMFVDEEEDSYWYLFDQRKSVLNSEGRNDLSVVITEFFTFLDLKWPIAFEKGEDQTIAQKVYEHLEKIADLSPSVWKEFEAEKITAKAKHIVASRRVEIFRHTFESAYPPLVGKFTAGELLGVLERLVHQNDAHNSFKRFREKARVLARLRDTFVESLTQTQAIPPYAAYRRLCELVVDKKYFTMSRASYGEVLDQPGQTFFSGESNIMATEFLKQVELRPETGNQTIRLVYREGEMVAGAFTLYDYLELVLFIAKVLNVESGDDAVTFAREDLERYPALARVRTEVRRLFRTNVATEGLRKETFEDELLTEAFFFNGTKSVVTLEESQRQADEYNLRADVSLTVAITSLRDTPEEDIVQAIGRNNGVYLMSATGGLSGVSSGAFNVGQLQRELQAKGGHVSDMTDVELEVVSAKAIELIARRQRQVTILNDDDPAMGFEVCTGYKGLRNMFHMALPQREDRGYAYLNTYKRHEIDGLVASLDVLLSTDVRSGLVLCQTVARVRTALMNLARGGAGGINQVDHDGHVFRINPRCLPRYRSAQDA